MKVVVFDVGQGDSILVVSPEGKTMLIDAGDETKGKQVVQYLKNNGVQQLDYFLATHAHPDHIGGAPAVLGAFKVGTVLHNGFLPPEMPAEDSGQGNSNKTPAKGAKTAKPAPAKQLVTAKGTKRVGKTYLFPTVTAYNNFKDAVDASGAKFEKAAPGQKIDLGGGAIITILAPIEPYFTKEQMREGGNEPNANSIVMRLDYGDFSMLLPGDAEKQTEDRLLAHDTAFNLLTAKILKVSHHGSKYASSDDFIKRVKPQVAIISDGEYNRYGHPSQAVLDRLKADGVTKVYRTDLQSDIVITTNGKNFEIKPSKDAKGDVWAGREATKDDSSRHGFITYGDFGPPPKPKPEKKQK
jgi:beta-lactamase superfamily II metal-dependent hydrolase